MRSKQEMLDWIEKKEEGYEQDRLVLENEEELNSSQLARIPRGASISCSNVATYRLYLGEASEARRWFKRAATHRFRAGQMRVKHKEVLERNAVLSATQIYGKAVQYALLSGSSECLEEIATGVLDLDESFRDVLDERGGSVLSYDDAELLAAVSLGEDEIARNAIERIRSFESDPSYDGYYSGVPDGHTGPLVDASIGLFDGDAAAVTEAVEKMLDAHEAEVDGEPRGSREIVDHAAAAMIVLARNRGLNVTVESEYVPDALFDEED